MTEISEKKVDCMKTESSPVKSWWLLLKECLTGAKRPNTQAGEAHARTHSRSHRTTAFFEMP
jgi:hypothetical protein